MYTSLDGCFAGLGVIATMNADEQKERREARRDLEQRKPLPGYNDPD
jgi:hypothetical protein